jgi:hypothetical protein
MRHLLRVPSIIIIWLFVSIFLLFGLLALFSKISDTKSFDTLFLSTSKDVFESPQNLASAPKEILSAVRSEDARPVLVERFLRKNGSPMVGYGEKFVEAADKYELDWRLLPAIAYQESTLGKSTPFGSYNAFGWGIVDNTNKGMSFQSWNDAIFTVAEGLRVDYYNNGLTTLKAINTVYAGDKNWNQKVSSAMEEISN